MQQENPMSDTQRIDTREDFSSVEADLDAVEAEVLGVRTDVKAGRSKFGVGIIAPPLPQPMYGVVIDR